MITLSTPVCGSLGQETLMNKFNHEFWKQKDQIHVGDTVWRLKNAEDNIQRLEFVLDKALQEIEKLQKASE
jgi:hypothetical protein